VPRWRRRRRRPAQTSSPGRRASPGAAGWQSGPVWLLLATAVLAGAVSALATWWSGPDSALNADAFRLGRFDVIDIVPVGYAIFAMALGICAGLLLRRTLPAIAVTLAGFVALRVVTAWLRLYYMTPVTVYYKLTANYPASGSFLPVSQGVVGPNGRPSMAGPGTVMAGPGQPIPAACRQALASVDPNAVASCVTAHGYRGVPDVPASQQVLGLSGHRDRHLRGARRRAARRHVLGAQATGRIAAPTVSATSSQTRVADGFAGWTSDYVEG